MIPGLSFYCSRRGFDMNKEECNIYKIEGFCCTCIECYMFGCPIAVSMMTEEEKRFYGVKEEK